MYLTENLDKAWATNGSGLWGSGRPKRREGLLHTSIKDTRIDREKGNPSFFGIC